MPPTIAPAPTAAKADPRVAAYFAPDGPEVFSGIVHGSQIWTPDPFDVEAVHADARDTFQRLLSRASGPDAPPHGVSLLLLGEAGSGKTHLMRAFRTAAHEQGTGYCGYLQMLCRADNYPRYVLSYLIDSLEQPYRPDDPTTGLMRLARGLLDALELNPEEVEQLCEDHLDLPELAKRVFRFAEIAVQIDRFKHIDVNVLRAFLFLLANDGRVRPKVLSWLRCEDLAPFDREALGGLVPRPGPEMPLKTIVSLGRLMRALPNPAALVLLVDQMDETLELGKTDAEPGEQFRAAVSALIDISESLPNAVVVIGCLENLFAHAKSKGYLSAAKLDRLEHNPEPIWLRRERAAAEVAEIAAVRLEAFFGAGVPADPANPTAPYTAADLAQLTGMRTRDILDFFREHRQRCVAARVWVPPSVLPPPPPPPPPADFAPLWNDFLPTVKPPTVDEPQLAELLAWAGDAATQELPNGLIIGTDADGRFIETGLQCGEAVDKVLLAICDKGAQGNGLKNQINETVVRAGENRAVFIRSTEFSKSPTAGVATQLAKLCAPVGKHRRVVVANADWRTMTAFRQFAQQHAGKPGFGEWRKQSRPLASLPSLRRILDLDTLEAAVPRPLPPAPPLPPAGKAKELTPPLAPAPTSANPSAPAQAPKAAGLIPLGQTRGSTPAAIDLEPKSLCRHAAFVGGSGSGKTTAALAAIEHLLLAGVPAVLLDRKGDLARYADPDVWSAPEPDPDRAARRARLRAAIDVRLYTPGDDRGRPLAIAVAPPGLAQAHTSDREQAARYAAAGLGLMMGYKAKVIDPKLVILQKAIEVLAAAGGAVTVKALHALLEDQDDALLSRFDGNYEEKHFRALRQDLYSIGAMHHRLFEAPEALDIDALLGRGAHATPGRTRLTVVNTRALQDGGTSDFWVSQLLLALDHWQGRNPSPGGEPQAVFLFDEADKYLPAVGKPATKGPMESLLRRARSAGLGLFLATQSPGDFDYKCRDQILTWLVGRVKEPVAIAKLKPMLESRPGAADKLADQKAGEFCLVREADVRPIHANRNLIPTDQLPADRILELARAGRARGSS